MYHVVAPAVFSDAVSSAHIALSLSALAERGQGWISVESLFVPLYTCPLHYQQSSSGDGHWTVGEFVAGRF